MEQWLNSGGDADERCATSGRTLLHVIASDRLRSDDVERGRCDIARLLLARGAEVNAIRIKMAPNTPLLRSLYHRKELCELLCGAGETQLQKFCHPHSPDFPLWFAVSTRYSRAALNANEILSLVVVSWLHPKRCHVE